MNNFFQGKMLKINIFDLIYSEYDLYCADKIILKNIKMIYFFV